MLTGRVLPLGDYIIIGTELVDAADGSQLWGEQYRRSVLDIFAEGDDPQRAIAGNALSLGHSTYMSQPLCFYTSEIFLLKPHI